ncbi:hypothetical protein EMIT0111MI5_300016 [Burkholderia sp. IT-111MI5]
MCAPRLEIVRTASILAAAWGAKGRVLRDGIRAGVAWRLRIGPAKRNGRLHRGRHSTVAS